MAAGSEVVAKFAHTFGMWVLAGDCKREALRREGCTAFDAVPRESDIVTLYSPPIAAARDMIGVWESALLMPTALLVNPVRAALWAGRSLRMHGGMAGLQGRVSMCWTLSRRGGEIHCVGLICPILSGHRTWSG